MLAALLLPLAFADAWPDPALVDRLEANRPEFNHRESEVPEYNLPAVLCADGVGGGRAWDGRRAELLDLFRTHVYGRRPGPPRTLSVTRGDATPVFGGAGTRREITVTCGTDAGSLSFPLTVILPANADAADPVPVFLLMNNRDQSPDDAVENGFWPADDLVARGYGAAVFAVGDVDPDRHDGFANGVHALFPELEGAGGDARPGDAWGTLAAWGWGASRALDALRADPAVNGDRVAIAGHSRGGKAALWAAAEDPRFGMAISNQSGCGGAALSRRRFGETVERINTAFPHWFARNFREFNGREETLPVDQHQLIALVAPRPVYVASASEDLWADPRGEFLSLAHANPVYALFGDETIDPNTMPAPGEPLIAGSRGYHLRPGPHNLTERGWGWFLDFADAVWER